jgi:hypothetical protein
VSGHGRIQPVLPCIERIVSRNSYEKYRLALTGLWQVVSCTNAFSYALATCSVPMRLGLSMMVMTSKPVSIASLG